VLTEIIQNRLESSLVIYDRTGQMVPNEKIKKEYNSIKQYLQYYHHDDPCIAITLKKDYTYFLTILACLEIGLPYIPLKWDYPEDRIKQIQADSSFRLNLNEEKLVDILQAQVHPIKTLQPIPKNKAAYIIFTSGSTGRPKGVIIQRSALENFMKFIDHQFEANQDDRLLQVTEFTFDISVSDISLFLTKNVSLYFSGFENNILKLGHEIDTHRINILVTVPNNLNMFLSDLIAARMDCSCLKHILIAGSRFSYGLYEKCQKYFTESTRVYNLYGPTEATVYSHFHELSYDLKKDTDELNVSIGYSLPGMHSCIVLDNKKVQMKERGELFIGGEQLMKEYINNPEQTDKALVYFEDQKYYRSGDLAYQDEQGKYYIVGRTDDTIKYRGFRINLLDIDSYITRLPYVQDSATIAIPHEQFENQTICFIILREEKTVKEIKKDLSSLLLDFQIPEKIIVTESYPTNTSGKVCRKTLRADYLSKKL